MNAPVVEARRWWQQAQADLTVVHTLCAAGHHAAACFQSQQAAEKAVKAVLFAHGARVVLGPSVHELVRQCAAHDATFEHVVEPAALLDQFYISTRYPNGLPFPAVPSETFTNAQASTAQDAAAQIMAVVEAYLRTHTAVLP
jgi:HEPN domain-containing protein